MSASPPSTLGKYEIIREIARSNDIVYEGYDPLMNRRVAVKELAIPSGSTPQQKEDRIRRFEREVKAAGSLAHPHIVTIYEVGEDQGRHFMAMEFLDGQTLRGLVDSQGFLPQDRAVEIAIDVLSALDFAHKHGVIHRDIKPDNIQILENGTVKLTDFGIARLTFEPNLTMDGQVFGTPSYMSPEQVVGREIDARSDIFSLGVVLFEMLSGQKPFVGDNVMAIAHAVTNQNPVCPPTIGWAMWQVLEKAMDKSPVLRFDSAADFSAALKSASQSGQVQAAPTPPPPPPPANIYGTGAYSPGIPPAMPPMMPPQYNPYPTGQVPYQPYGASAPPPMPTHTPYNPVPVYYPPPPRQPLLSPQAKAGWRSFFLTLIVVGALFALVISAVNSLGKAATREANHEPAASPTANPEAPSPVPTESSSPAPQPKVDEAAHEVKLGNDAIDRGQLTDAQMHFNQAIEIDSKSYQAHFGLGRTYERLAITDAVARGDWLRSAADEFARAKDLARTADDRRSCASRSANHYLNLGDYFEETRDHSSAREMFIKARSVAEPGSSEYNEANQKMLKFLDNAGR